MAKEPITPQEDEAYVCEGCGTKEDLHEDGDVWLCGECLRGLQASTKEQAVGEAAELIWLETDGDDADRAAWNEVLEVLYDDAVRIETGTLLQALRTLSEALGDPFKGDTTKTCIDLAALAAAKLKATDECTKLAHSLAYESATGYIDSASTTDDDGWLDMSGWSPEELECLADLLRYLNMRGLIERKEGQPHLIRFRDESEATNG